MIIARDSVERYNTSQPRDDAGKWTTVGGHHVFVGNKPAAQAAKATHGTLGAQAAAAAIFGASAPVVAAPILPKGVPVSVWQPKSGDEAGGHVKVMTTGEAATSHHVEAYGDKFGLSKISKKLLQDEGNSPGGEQRLQRALVEEADDRALQQ